MNPAVEFVDVTKRYPGLIANSGISFPVFPGEIHAIVGENGAGKSTLMGILSGFVKPEEGQVNVFGRRLELGSPRAALRAGIGLCAQHFHLVPTLTGMENILLGAPGHRLFAPLSHRAQDKVRELMKKYGLKTSLEVPVSDLSVGECERIEILKLLYREAKILILDEPTAVLAPSEVESLFTVLRQLRKEGKAILFITHKLPEVMAVADRVTVLRAGKVEGTVRAEGLDTRTLVSLIIGGEPLPDTPWLPRIPGEPVLEVEKLSAGDSGHSLQRVSLRVREGEIVGVGGVEGNGQRELVAALMGYIGRDHGEIRFLGRPVHPDRTPAFRRRIGVIPEDRRKEGLLPSRNLIDNAVLGFHDRPPFRRGLALRRSEMRAQAHRIVDTFSVYPPRLDLPARAFSGGNQQRFIAGRELSRRPPFLLAVHPTRGVDIRATQFIHARLLEERARGTAILLVTADLTELRTLSDRILILYRGKVAYESSREALDPEAMNRSLLGLENQEANG
ncbi:MAG: ABC transporter ATP-binding protein [Candidatus Eisenbacteria bacterium]|nr:ABC transporter ATP-binding protein [Candidatus Eisenbacteria bacterium]